MKRDRKIVDEPIRDNFHFTAEVSYLMGGLNWMTGNTFPRGFYLTAMVVEREPIEPGASVRIERMILGRGFKKLLKEAARFSQKALDGVEVPPALLAELREATLRQAGLLPMPVLT